MVGGSKCVVMVGLGSMERGVGVVEGEGEGRRPRSARRMGWDFGMGE